jgi:hypothetical protein
MVDYAAPPPKWQAKRAALRDSTRKFYTFKKGQVEQLDFDKFSDLKRAKSEEIARNKGKFYSIEKPESLLNKRRKVQDKLWYYDKRNYPPRPKPELPQFNMFYIRRPNTADRTRKELEAQREPTPVPVPKKEPPKKEPPRPVSPELEAPRAKNPDPEPPRREPPPRKVPPKPKTPEPVYEPKVILIFLNSLRPIEIPRILTHDLGHELFLYFSILRYKRLNHL